MANNSVNSFSFGLYSVKGGITKKEYDPDGPKPEIVGKWDAFTEFRPWAVGLPFGPQPHVEIESDEEGGSRCCYYGAFKCQATKLDITIYFPKGGAQWLWEHELGHAQIARAAAQRFNELGRLVFLRYCASTCEEASKFFEAAIAVGIPSMRCADKLEDFIQRFNDEYDEATDHGKTARGPAKERQEAVRKIIEKIEQAQ